MTYPTKRINDSDVHPIVVPLPTPLHYAVAGSDAAVVNAAKGRPGCGWPSPRRPAGTTFGDELLVIDGDAARDQSVASGVAVMVRVGLHRQVEVVRHGINDAGFAGETDRSPSSFVMLPVPAGILACSAGLKLMRRRWENRVSIRVGSLRYLGGHLLLLW